MDQLKAMRTFVAVCDRGGFSAGGLALGLSKAVVSKRVSELEDHLGCRLLQRTTRRHHLTEEGQRYLAHCRETLEEISHIEDELACRTFRPEGHLRVNAAMTFGLKFISPLIAPFKETYPDVMVEFSLTDRYVDLIEEGVDLAIRVGGDPNSAMIARRLGAVRHAIYASPDYLKRHGCPKTASDLKHHQCLVSGRTGRIRAWCFDNHSITPQPAFLSNNGDVLTKAAIDGMGLTCLPDFIVADAVMSGQLVLVAADPDEQVVPVLAVYPARAHLPLKVRSFIDFLAERLEKKTRPITSENSVAAH